MKKKTTKTMMPLSVDEIDTMYRSMLKVEDGDSILKSIGKVPPFDAERVLSNVNFKTPNNFKNTNVKPNNLKTPNANVNFKNTNVKPNNFKTPNANVNFKNTNVKPNNFKTPNANANFKPNNNSKTPNANANFKTPNFKPNTDDKKPWWKIW